MAQPCDRGDPSGGEGAGQSIRLDRWLCHARLFKTRTLAAARIAEGGIRVNGTPCRKPAHSLKVGDVVTAAVPGGVRSLRVLSPGNRRGPVAEARGLYDDLAAASSEARGDGQTSK